MLALDWTKIYMTFSQNIGQLFQVRLSFFFFYLINALNYFKLYKDKF